MSKGDPMPVDGDILRFKNGTHSIYFGEAHYFTTTSGERKSFQFNLPSDKVYYEIVGNILEIVHKRLDKRK